MQKLLIATTNAHKLQEIKELIKDLSLGVVSPKDINKHGQAEETGKTFEENARLKAQYWGEKPGLLTLAEDSGLEIDALGGKPGIYSARYSEGSDSDRTSQILKEMKNIPEGKRSARYCEVVALYNPLTKEIKTFEGISEGKITTKPDGGNGFGYDPIFYSFDLKKTFAEASMEEKNQISHRGKAFNKVKEYLVKKPLK